VGGGRGERDKGAGKKRIKKLTAEQHRERTGKKKKKKQRGATGVAFHANPQTITPNLIFVQPLGAQVNPQGVNIQVRRKREKRKRNRKNALARNEQERAAFFFPSRLDTDLSLPLHLNNNTQNKPHQPALLYVGPIGALVQPQGVNIQPTLINVAPTGAIAQPQGELVAPVDIAIAPVDTLYGPQGVSLMSYLFFFFLRRAREASCLSSTQAQARMLPGYIFSRSKNSLFYFGGKNGIFLP